MTMPQAMLGSAIVAALIAIAVARGAAQRAREDEVQVRFDFKGATITAVLDPTPAARDFLSMLPVTIRLEDYASTEEIGYLPRRLTTEGEPAGSQPRAGDFSYCAPWGISPSFTRTSPIRQGSCVSDASPPASTLSSTPVGPR
jgi:hypothetical protein